MTRKDYVCIADSIRENLLYNPDDRLDIGNYVYLSDLLDSLCRKLKNDNPRFNESKFREYVLE